jgi:hypothetical protein
MKARKKVPAVEKNRHRDWLKRNEDGQTPPMIAKADGYDVRTVRRGIKSAREEREKLNARTELLRNALDDHFKDMVTFTEKIADYIDNYRPSRGLTIELLSKEPLWVCLKEHLPRATMWRELNLWDQMQHDIEEQKRMGGESMVDWFNDNGVSPEECGIDRDELAGHLGGTLLESWSYQDPIKPEGIAVEKGKGGLMDIRYGRYHMFSVPNDMVEAVCDVLGKLHLYANELEELDMIRRGHVKLQELSNKIHEELTGIKLRRILPGECRYCPF